MVKEEDAFGVGRALAPDAWLSLPMAGMVQRWEPLQLELEGGQYPDYLASDLACRICSERLREILQNHASPLDSLQWLEAIVSNGADARQYFVLHFPQPPDILDARKTIFAGDFVVKAVLSKHRVNGHHVFGYPNCGQLPLFISDQVRQAVERAHCTGMEIARVPIT